MPKKSFFSRIGDPFRRQEGVAALPVILVLIVIIVAIGVSLVFLGGTETSVTAGQAQSAQALLYAEAGARDALYRISENSAYTCAAANCYLMNMAANGCAAATLACAQVSVSAGTGASGDPKIITSTGQSGQNIRKVEVDVIFDASLLGQIATTTWSEIK